MKHTKYFSFILLFSVCCSTAFAQLTYQQAVNAQRKYWYYRYRLLNDFLLEGDCQGCSIPAAERYITNKKYNLL